MYKQIDIFGNIVEPQPNKDLKTYEVFYERNDYATHRTVEAKSEAQAKFFIQKLFNFKVKVLAIQEIE